MYIHTYEMTAQLPCVHVVELVEVKAPRDGGLRIPIERQDVYGHQCCKPSLTYLRADKSDTR